jgi:hypothetical protein
MDEYTRIAGALRAQAGGANADLSVARSGADAIDALLQELETQRRRARALDMEARTRGEFGLRMALREIVAQETPGANATVQRMARLARAALGDA